MIIKKFDDDLYEKTNITNIRHTVRCLIKNQDHKYIFLQIKGSDDFGERNHLETIGGGIENNEDKIIALKREVMEEIGLEINNIHEIGTIIDRYYLIGRETHSHFFYGEVNSENSFPTALTDSEKTLFAGLVYLDEDEVISKLDYTKQNNVGKLVQRRDLLAFNYYLEHKKS